MSHKVTICVVMFMAFVQVGCSRHDDEKPQTQKVGDNQSTPPVDQQPDGKTVSPSGDQSQQPAMKDDQAAPTENQQSNGSKVPRSGDQLEQPSVDENHAEPPANQQAGGGPVPLTGNQIQNTDLPNLDEPFGLHFIIDVPGTSTTITIESIGLIISRNIIGFTDYYTNDDKSNWKNAKFFDDTKEEKCLEKNHLSPFGKSNFTGKFVICAEIVQVYIDGLIMQFKIDRPGLKVFALVGILLRKTDCEAKLINFGAKISNKEDVDKLEPFVRSEKSIDSTCTYSLSDLSAE